MEIVGWIGSICFIIAAFPQALKSYRDGNSDGLSWWFLWLWTAGEVFTLVYVVPKGHWPLITNYLINLLCLVVIHKYKFNPRPKVVET